MVFSLTDCFLGFTFFSKKYSKGVGVTPLTTFLARGAHFWHTPGPPYKGTPWVEDDDGTTGAQSNTSLWLALHENKCFCECEWMLPGSTPLCQLSLAEMRLCLPGIWSPKNGKAGRDNSYGSSEKNASIVSSAAAASLFLCKMPGIFVTAKFPEKKPRFSRKNLNSKETALDCLLKRHPSRLDL